MKIQIALTAAVLACPAAFAQPGSGSESTQPTTEPTTQPRTDLPAAADLFAKHVEAVGGEEAIRAHKNLLRRGAIRGDSSFALVTSWHEAPDKLRTRVETPGKPVIDTIFADGYGWRIRDARQADLVRNEGLRQLRDDADFFADLEPTRRYEQIRTTRLISKSETAEQAYEVQAKFPYGKIELHYFDVNTGLRIATLTSTTSPDGQIPLSIAYSDYREVSGVKMPHELSITSNAGEEDERISIVKFSEIRANISSVPSWDMPSVVAERIKQLETAKEDSGG